MTGPGVNVWIHLDTATSPVTVSWIYPDGTHEILNMTNGQPAEDVALVANNYLPFQVELPQNVTCDPSIGEEFNIIKVADQYDSSGRRNVYYMTWRVTC
jgi:hypothetical protein